MTAYASSPPRHSHFSPSRKALSMFIIRKLTFGAAVGLCSFGLVGESLAAQPYENIWTCLHTKIGWNVPNGVWKYNVQVTRGGDAFYIGTNQQHLTVLRGATGYHHTINGTNGGQQAARDIPDLLFACNTKTNPHCSTQIISALEYMHDKCP